ncbi:transcriptional regulator, TetR family [Carboxydocella sporoproducens DSM 16521]|uniref:Transcriptional regulator, TetR family n=2 Tax=Carboxydocella TaxID=178898 RepID=A0A1T4P153_9FIRM|nr:MULTISPECIES: TetR/AcrR family transcriptional regulator [Carboxydocella]AVX19597.1 transcriptional regulator, TetR family [Carboxydocella thermautotrophica]AVX30012.1 transcriptional regulator, TetR family [Carboxydocella thermautotrophica]SJZ85037.1 transcriptional regulator, TetR family [Carboxydocella sporoproducens DSM 16521]
METSGKREQILAAAMEVFSRRGFHEAKMEEIAAAAGVGKGTVYEYFSSKAELFQEMFRQNICKHLSRLEDAIAAETTTTGKIQRLLELHFQFAWEAQDLTRLSLDFGHLNFNQEFRQWILRHQRQKIELITRLVREGQEKGEIKTELNPHAVALVILGTFHSLFGAIMAGTAEDRLVNDIFSVIIQGLAGKTNN